MTYWSPASERFYGWTAAEALGRRLDELVCTPEQHAEFVANLAGISADHPSCGPIEIALRHRDGHAIWILYSVFTIEQPGGGQVFVCMDADISQRKAAEQALVAEQEFCTELFESLPHIAYLIDETGHYARWNRGYQTVLGWSAADMATMDATQTVAPADQPLAAQLVAQGLAGREWGAVLRGLTPDGQELPHFCTGKRVEYAGKSYLLGFAVDIREQLAAEQAVRESEEALRAIIDLSPTAICLHDEHGAYVQVNPAFERLSQLAANELVGRRPPDVFPQLDQARLAEIHERFQLEGGFDDEELTYVIAGVAVRHTLTSMRPVTLRGQRYWVAYTQDITARKAVEAEREALIARLEQTNAELERFTYTVSHDLKSPLITIKGFLGWVRKDLEQARIDHAVEALGRIDRAAEHMRGLLDDLLELSRIGRVVNLPEVVAVSDLVAQAVDLLAIPLAEHGYRIHQEPGLPLVRGDRQRFVEVFQNLFDNCLKFRGEHPEPGAIVGCAGLDEVTGYPLLYVRDNGLGLDPAYAERIFRLFERLAAGQTGTGIGLAIARRIVETHGGRIWAESEGPGTGACFWLTLPPATDQDGAA